MRGRDPSADSAAGMAGGGSGRLRNQPFWPESDKSDSTERREATSLHLLGVLLKLRRRHIAQSRVEPLLVVDAFDEFADRGVGVGQIAIFGSVNLLVLECFDKALRLGIVVGISAPAHTDGHTVLLQQINVSAAGILHAAIGMMHQSWRRFPLSDGPSQGRQGKL